MEIINIKRGFTLLELAIAMLVMGVVATGYLSYNNLLKGNQEILETSRRIQVVKDAIISFVALNGRLPCPASPSQIMSDNTFGYEQIDTTSSPATCITSNTNITSLGLSGDTLYYGTIPTRSLQLSDEYMVDAWDNRIAYVVQKSFVNNGSSYSNLVVTNSSCTTGDNAQDIQNNNIYLCFRGQASGSVDLSTPDLQVYPSYSALQSGSPMLSGDAVYVLISAGPDGYGSYYKYSGVGVDEGGTASTTSTQNPMPANYSFTEGEYINAGCDPTNGSCSSTAVYGYKFITRSPSNNFDDIVAYRNRNQLLIDCNNYLNNSCTGVLGIELK